MIRFPIYLNYDPTLPPVGFVEIEEEHVPMKALNSCAIVPQSKGSIDRQPDSWEVVAFGLIPRTTVDTRPKSELGET